MRLCSWSLPPEARWKGGITVKYRVHRFDIKMTKDQDKSEQFLNSLEGEVKAIIPNVTVSFFGFISSHCGEDCLS